MQELPYCGAVQQSTWRVYVCLRVCLRLSVSQSVWHSSSTYAYQQALHHLYQPSIAFSAAAAAAAAGLQCGSSEFCRALLTAPAPCKTCVHHTGRGR